MPSLFLVASFLSSSSSSRASSPSSPRSDVQPPAHASSVAPIAAPVTTSPATVTSRRTEVTGGGESRAVTTYHATFSSPTEPAGKFTLTGSSTPSSPKAIAACSPRRGPGSSRRDRMIQDRPRFPDYAWVFIPCIVIRRDHCRGRRASGYARRRTRPPPPRTSRVEIGTLTASSNAGAPLGSIHPTFPFVRRVLGTPRPTTLAGHDALILALPHGHSAALAAALPDETVVIDCGADFRLERAGDWTAFYDTPYAGSWPMVCRNCRCRTTRLQRAHLRGATRWQFRGAIRPGSACARPSPSGRTGRPR